jgi:anti-sigma factor RsiW
MNGSPRISDDELHGFLDGEIPPERAKAIAREIADDPLLASRVAAFRGDQELLRRVFASVSARPLPAAWTTRIEQATIPQRSPARYIAIAAMAACVLLIFGALGFYSGILDRGDATVVEALAARRQQLALEQHLTGTAIEVPGKRDDTLQAALHLPLKVPDLSASGYRLVGMDVYAGGAAAHAVTLTYKDAQGRDFTLYVRPSAGATRFDLLKRGALRICVWQDDEVTAVMMGEMSAGEMMRIASRAYAELSS